MEDRKIILSFSDFEKLKEFEKNYTDKMKLEELYLKQQEVERLILRNENLIKKIELLLEEDWVVQVYLQNLYTLHQDNTPIFSILDWEHKKIIQKEIEKIKKLNLFQRIFLKK